jgi:hypothetical protein
LVRKAGIYLKKVYAIVYISYRVYLTLILFTDLFGKNQYFPQTKLVIPDRSNPQNFKSAVPEKD